MNTEAAILAILCATSVGAISLTSSSLFRRDPKIASELMALVSFFPGFLFASATYWFSPVILPKELGAALLVKNLIYCLSFYYRYESLRVFGPFVGSLMLGAQPIIIFVLGSLILGENLTEAQSGSMVLASLGLLLLARRDKRAQEKANIGAFNFTKYFLLPTFAAAIVIVWDRYFLRGEISGYEFFIIDRLFMIPALISMLGIVHRKEFFRNILSRRYFEMLHRNWGSMALIGILFTGSVYTYNLALEIEKAALISVVRNSSYPLAALVGAFLFHQKLTIRKWLSFSLIFLSVVLTAA